MLSHVSRQKKEIMHFSRRMYWCQTFRSQYLKPFNALCLFIMRTALLQWESSGMHCRPILANKKDKYRHYARIRSEEHTSELQSPDHLVCRLLLEKKNHTNTHTDHVYPISP